VPGEVLTKTDVSKDNPDEKNERVIPVLLKKRFIVALFVITNIFQLHARSNLTTSYYSVRSQASSGARDLVGVVDYIHLCDCDSFYGCFSTTAEYTRSFNSDIVSDCLFGRDLLIPCDGDRRIVVSGSRVPDRNERFDWLADYFGLPTDFKSVLTFDPRIENFIIDFNFFLGLNNILNGLYVRVDVPFVQTRRSLNLKECVVNSGSNNYLPGYFTPDEVERCRLLQSFTQFAQCGMVPNLPNNVFFEPLRFAKMTGKETITKTGFAEIETVIGYDFLLDPEYHFGLNIHLGIPVGTRPTGEFLFEPVVGNGRHMFVGVGADLHALIWANECCNRRLSVHVDGSVCDLLVAEQTRFFDLREKRTSRYMLAQRLALPIENDLHTKDDDTDQIIFPEAQFKSCYAPVANITASKVKVHGGFETDVAIMGHYVHDCFSFDFGYNFWFRSCERTHADLDCLPPRFMSKQWVLKGDAHNFGFEPDESTVALSASQSDADLHRALNFGRNLQESEGITNPRINNPSDALTTGDVELVATPGDDNTIKTSIQPRFIVPTSLDFCISSSESSTHTFFVHASYEGPEWQCMIPSIGIGGKVSGAFADDDLFKRASIGKCTDPCSSNQSVACTKCSDQCLGCGIFEWGFWIKGCLAFD